jgi:hypothetical protein
MIHKSDRFSTVKKVRGKFRFAAILFVIAFVILGTACINQAPPLSNQPELPEFNDPTLGRFESGGNGIDSLVGLGINGADAALGSSQNVSEINVDVTSVTPRQQRYTFIIGRGDNQVRVTDAESAASASNPGDILATLAIDILDPDLFTASSRLNSVQPLVGFSIDYNGNSLRILNDSGANVPATPAGQRKASTQAEASGVLATLTVEALDSSGPDAESSNGSDQGETYTSRDRHETLIDLSGEPEGGTVRINVRIQETDPPVAALSPVDDSENGNDTSENPPQPDAADNQQDASQNNDDENPDPDSGDNNQAESNTSEDTSSNSGNTGQNSDSGSSSEDSPKEGQSSQQETDPDDELDDDIVNAGSGDGDSFNHNFDIVLIIDSSTSLNQRSRDPDNYRGQAARAFLSMIRPGDQVGFVHFIEYAEVTKLTPVPQQSRVSNRGVKRDLIKRLEDNITLPGTGFSNIERALNSACDLLETGRAPNRAAILLTDGDSGQNVVRLSDPLDCNKDADWPVHTMAIADPKEEVLDHIADETDGVAVIPENPQAMVCEIQRLRAMMQNGTAPACESQNVKPGGNLASLSRIVPQGQSQATFSISWSGNNRLRMEIFKPSGAKFIPSVSFAEDMTAIWDGPENSSGETVFETITILNPEPGRWQVRLFQPAILPEGQDVVFGFTTLPALR